MIEYESDLGIVRPQGTTRGPLIIHHADCFDGVAAAWVAWKFFRDRRVAVEVLPAFYGDKPPDVVGREIYIVDFSYPREEILKLREKNPNLLILDHHKTAEEALKGLDYAIFDMNRSGCGIAWDWWFPGELRPWFITAIEDRDLWILQYRDTRKQIAYISTLDYNVGSYDSLTDTDPNVAAEKGNAILQYITKYGEKAAEHCFIEEIGGVEFPIINISYQNCSEHLDALIARRNGIRAASFFFRGKDRKWQFSLRSRGDFDVSKIAKIYNGGGHKNAAGFEVEVLPWEMGDNK
jgi:oligoribonuclease NrnB/cAMP/cGMP phosphodiesterase (DHH superfamily)